MTHLIHVGHAKWFDGALCATPRPIHTRADRSASLFETVRKPKRDYNYAILAYQPGFGHRHLAHHGVLRHLLRVDSRKCRAELVVLSAGPSKKGQRRTQVDRLVSFFCK
jgi:hypothetical protein